MSHFGRRDATLIVGGLPLAASAGGRLIGCLVDGFSLTHLAFAAFEVVGAVVCGVALRHQGSRRNG